MELFTLTITKENYIEFLEYNSSTYFLQRLRNLCNVVPEFTYHPIFYKYNGMWRYDSEHFWADNLGRCSLQFYNSYFGFNDLVNKFECIQIDYKSFEIKQAGKKKIRNFCGVPIDYLSSAQQKVIKEQEEEQQKEFRIDDLKNQRTELIAELKTLESEE